MMSDVQQNRPDEETPEYLSELKKLESIFRNSHLWQAFAEDYGLLSLTIEGEEVRLHDIEIWLSLLEHKHRVAIYEVYICDLTHRELNKSEYRSLAEEGLRLVLNSRIQRRVLENEYSKEWGRLGT